MVGEETLIISLFISFVAVGTNVLVVRMTETRHKLTPQTLFPILICFKSCNSYK